METSKFGVPAAIVVAGLVVAGAIYFKGGGGPASVSPLPEPQGPGEKELAQVRPIAAGEHLRGNPDAPIKIVEYSDLECPFCKRFHITLQQVMSEYPEQVAWAYRHFPLDSLHRKARQEAEATECAAELGGPPGSQASNETFWQYVDKIFEVTPSNDGLDLAQLPKLAAAVGLDEAAFNECLQSGRHKERVQADLDNAVASGGQGTPFSVVIGPNDERIPLPGALDFGQLKPLLDQLLAQT